jgi:hypothetical protein
MSSVAPPKGSAETSRLLRAVARAAVWDREGKRFHARATRARLAAVDAARRANISWKEIVEALGARSVARCKTELSRWLTENHRRAAQREGRRKLQKTARVVSSDVSPRA